MPLKNKMTSNPIIDSAGSKSKLMLSVELACFLLHCVVQMPVFHQQGTGVFLVQDSPLSKHLAAVTK